MRRMIVAAAVWLGGCASIRGERPAEMNHVVLFKLKLAEDAAALIADSDASLPRIPGVVSYFAGRHLDVGRANVEKDYDVGLYVGFDTEASYRAYLDHPLHTELVTRWRPKWEWIRIYDVRDPTP